MTPEKLKQKLAGQTTIAQKVFQYVPVAERWGVQQVMDAMRRATSARMDIHIVRGCLSALVDAGLVKTFRHNTEYQRIHLAAKEQRPMNTAAIVTTAAAPSAVQPVRPAVQASSPSAPLSALDLLGSIAATLRQTAAELEATALAIEEGKAKDSDELGKLRQLQVLLKGLA